MTRRVGALLRAMTVGALVAIALTVMLGVAQKQFVYPRVVAASALAGALMASVFVFVQPAHPRDLTRRRAIGCGLGYAALGFFLFLIVLAFAALVAETDVQIRGCFPALMVLVAFGGLGVAFGMGFRHLQRAESERQGAALARQELDLARDMQQRLLPPPVMTGEGFRITAKNVPAAWVAGDFYDFVPLADGRILIALCDVAGKGVAAGMIVASTKAVLPMLAAQEPAVERVLGLLNDKLARELTRREFVAMIVAIYDPRSGTLDIANAGMPDPVLVHMNLARAIEVPGPRYPAGVRASLAYQSVRIALRRGDRVVLLSDGLPEARGVNDMQFGYERLLEEIAHAESIDALFARFESLVRGDHEDDWTAVELFRSAAAEPPL